MKKLPKNRNVLYDRIHKGGVFVCLGLTLYGSLIVGEFVYKHFKYSRPQIAAAKAAAEAELLAEGSSERFLKD